MTKWKSLREDPPSSDCKICIKIGTYYDVYDFERFSETGWGLIRDKRVYDLIQIPEHALYINLDEIIPEYGLQNEYNQPTNRGH